MNDNELVQHMIDFVCEKEKSAQVENLKGSSKGKIDVVKLILNELENNIENENK